MNDQTDQTAGAGMGEARPRAWLTSEPDGNDIDGSYGSIREGVELGEDRPDFGTVPLYDRAAMEAEASKIGAARLRRLQRKLEQKKRRIEGLERRIAKLESSLAIRSGDAFVVDFGALRRDLERAVTGALCNVRMIPVLDIGGHRKIVEVRTADA